jgi:diguanylate cyclase (GGDEF)-like protein
VFVFHEYQKRTQAKTDARTAAAEAAQARTRSEELEQLMAFGQSLANSLDRPALQQTLWKFVPTFTGNRRFWILARKGDRWDALLRDTDDARPIEEAELLAMRAVSPDGGLPGSAPADDDDVCFPLVAGGVPVGVIGVCSVPRLSSEDRKALGAAAALIAISVRNMQMFLEMREMSLRDGLTGCFNRAHAIETLDAELRRSRRSSRPVSIVMFDVDHFKTINDQLGHLRGDELLQQIGQRLTKIVRATDVRCRYGGDEFLIILPDTPALGAEQVAECMRRELGSLVISAGDRSMPITVSIGVATATAGDRSPAALIDRADDALYQAKRGGRDRYCTAAPATPPLALVRS